MTKLKTMELAPVYAPVDWTLADAQAMQALERGEANADQQKRALSWVIHRVGMLNDMEFRSGPSGERDSAFMGGRRFAALQIRKLLLVDLAKQQERENDRTSSR